MCKQPDHPKPPCCYGHHPKSHPSADCTPQNAMLNMYAGTLPLSSRNVAWTDESRLTLVHTDGMIRVWHKLNEVNGPSCQQDTLQPGVVPGIFAWGLLIGLKWDPRYMWHDVHHRSTLLGLLDDHVLPLYISNIPLKISSFNKTFIPCHLSWIMFKSLDENATNINLLPWPVMSPDLNPI